ncbi:MtrAB system histidine kinase MtrB [Rhodococcus sp. X156]|uniref:MtrAB system histidine kinase MtrB n=1 Tax=Rhodococcus sp. X156 TaxID=2499145 RepID=UPI000FDBB8F8|nr:MtrAB system histidine kinase MtrB [Rhodococcus sp. X156]
MYWWRRSLQLRVVLSTLALSAVLVLTVGVALLSQITDRLLDAKINAAVEEVERARATVQRELAGADESNSLRSRLNSASSALTSPGIDMGGSASGGAGAFEPVLIVRGDGPRGAIASGPIAEVPTSLRPFVQKGQLTYQYTSIAGAPTLVVGTPAPSDVAGLELYLVFPLNAEERSISLIKGTMSLGGGVLLLLLGGVAALVTRQVVLPIRTAVDAAERFADGQLEARMPVRGEDDVARLGLAFNDMAANLADQIAQLEEFGALQRQFTSDVSHELRTPLTTVRMAADVLHAGSDEMDPALRRSAELLVAELDRFETLLNDLLEISRHDAGMADLAAEPLDLRLCVRGAVDTVRHLVAQTGSELLLDLPEDKVTAEVDARRVERVLRNLLANALDHGEGRPVLVQMRASDQSVSVLVRDSGIGLQPGEAEKVFNRFWRADPSRVRRSGGTGLGLAIAVEDARLHGGSLQAWGEPGRGACFLLTLPLRRGAALVDGPIPLVPTEPFDVANVAVGDVVQPPSTASVPDRATAAPDVGVS